MSRPAGVEDDRWAEVGEFYHQQGERMTAGWRGVSLTTSRVENDRWAERGYSGEFDHYQGLRMTAGRRGVNLTTSRG